MNKDYSNQSVTSGGGGDFQWPRPVMTLQPLTTPCLDPRHEQVLSKHLIHSMDFYVKTRMDWVAYAGTVALMMGIDQPVTLMEDAADHKVVCVWSINDTAAAKERMLLHFYVTGPSSSLPVRVAAAIRELWERIVGFDNVSITFLPCSVVQRIAIRRHEDDYTVITVTLDPSFRSLLSEHVSDNGGFPHLSRMLFAGGYGMSLKRRWWFPDETTRQEILRRVAVGLC
ncbi:hypothetical protein CONPUDRAFT_164620 [Coniophora puteana RWD-64-598 SS2]|uniref:Uncharacterized protein n=1 Tax=Coniophora puteana (strain RWD-64-598) TaxID=741705 RepID=A0A5M3MRW3_CONPW|nr:uncharacterized protein CONPUDRAFT_164620 [Coniophora puteana RWD-64-598 SS2]EIW81893.1 hypothetical protein CONPUDRAFT_164620 [Coniophora puteana RWD-64-598 SS2]